MRGFDQEADHARVDPRGHTATVECSSEATFGVKAAADRCGLGWHLVHTTREDQLAGDALRRLVGVENIYRPMVWLKRRIAYRNLSRDRRKETHRGRVFYCDVPRPLWPRYLFVKVDPGSEVWLRVNYAAGVQGFSCDGGRPYRVPDAFVEVIMQQEQAGAIPGKTRWVDILFAVGETVRISDGPMRGWDGTIECLDESERVRLLLSIFGRATPIDLDLDQIEKL